MTLSLYLARRFLRALFMVAAMFLTILWFIEMIEAVRRYGGEGGLARAAALATLALPSRFYVILPLVTLLGSIAMLLGLARGSELVAIRAAGRSALRMLMAPALAAFCVGALAVAALNPIVAATTKRHAEVAASAGVIQTLSLGQGVVWLRQTLGPDAEGTTGQAVIRATRASADATVLHNASFVLFGPDGIPVQRIDAARANLTPGAWRLEEVKIWPLTAANPEAEARHEAESSLPTDLTAEGIRDGFGDPSTVPIWQLPRFIAGLEAAGFTAQRHQMHLQSELARPLVMVAMLMLAAGFTMHQLRGRRTGMLVLAAFGAGLGLFFLQYFAQVLGERGDVPPALAAWAPPVVALMIAVARLLRLEDG